MNPCQHCGRQHPPGASTCPVTGDAMSEKGLIGARIDRYELERVLGAGGFGAVYRARHVHTDAIVALKLLKRQLGADHTMIERFLREAKAAAAVGSEHIVRVTDAGVATDGQAFLAMEYLEGWDLKELSAREPLSPTRLTLLTLQVLDGLGAAHARGIVHRDMKPANIFVTRHADDSGAERDFVKLLDFGISKMHADGATSGLTMTGVAMGTPSYMAPEQFFDARSVDGRADLYSMSVVLYELLSGKLPFDAQSYAELIIKVRTEQPLPLGQVAPGVPATLAQVVMVGLSREKERRWPSTREFDEALRAAMGLPPKGSTPPFVPLVRGPLPQGEGLDKTATPSAAMRAGLQPQLATPPPPTGAPNVVASPSLIRDGQPAQPVGWVGTPPSQPQPQGWSTPQPQGWPGTPAPQAGWGTPAQQPGWGGGVVPRQVQGQVPAGQAPQKSNTLKWVLIVLGVLFVLGGCCTCGMLMSAAQTQNQAQEQP